MIKITNNQNDLNNPNRFKTIRDIVQKKYGLKSLYLEVYQKYSDCINRAPSSGKILEIGSGAGFAKEIIPNLITTDVVAYAGIDQILDATKMDYADNSLACICMYNVLHHIPDASAFFNEAVRCLVPSGRILMIEPYPGWIGAPIYKYIHHEEYNPNVEKWEFESTGPVSDANNALPYVIFERDAYKFKALFPTLSITQFTPHTPLRYWLTGGLKKWSLLPKWSFQLMTWLDKKLIQISPRFGSFVDIELVKK